MSLYILIKKLQVLYFLFGACIPCVIFAHGWLPDGPIFNEH